MQSPPTPLFAERYDSSDHMAGILQWETFLQWLSSIVVKVIFELIELDIAAYSTWNVISPN